MRRTFIGTRRRAMGWGVLVAVIIALPVRALIGQWDSSRERQPPAQMAAYPFQDSGSQAGAEATLQHAFETRGGPFWIEASGRVVQLLPDDREGSRHQRIILVLGSDQTLLLAHNIDVAPRIERLEPGDTVRFRGEYLWNAKGGVIHWTHHDPAGRQAGGWLEYRGRRYR